MLGESVGAEALRISAANVQVNFSAPDMDMTDLVISRSCPKYALVSTNYSGE